MLSDEQMRKRWPFSLLNNEQMSNWLGVEHFPVKRIWLGEVSCFVHRLLVAKNPLCFFWPPVEVFYGNVPGMFAGCFSIVI